MFRVRTVQRTPGIPVYNGAVDPGLPDSLPEPPAEAREKDAARAVRTCPNCGRELSERKCKLFCPDPACGYYLSCSDFY